MRIYKLTIEHLRYGKDWDTEKVAARTCEEAIRKCQTTKDLKQARVQEVELLADTD